MIWGSLGVVWIDWQIWPSVRELGSQWDPCGILVGSLWDPCGIPVGSLWDLTSVLVGAATSGGYFHQKVRSENEK